ncbi:MAG: hypothetical protein IT289_10695 [Oligoflexia bacterium]|nr:hypothetical protein [Oligoflexia bacterium]
MSTLNVNNYGDLPLHLTYINSFVKGLTFWPQNPIYALDKLHYPVGMDFFSSLLSVMGVSLERSLPLVGFFMGILLVWALWSWAGAFGIGAFLFSGGLAGLTIFGQGVLRDFQAEVAWKSLPLALYVPQRGFLYAFPLGLTLLWAWKARFVDRSAKTPFWLEGLLWGLLPLFHIHSFIAVSLIFAIWTVWQRAFKEALPIFAVAVLPATLEVLFLTEYFRQASLLWFKAGWLFKPQEIFFIGDAQSGAVLKVFNGLLNFVYFFFNNFGFYIPLTAFAVYFAHQNKRKDLALLLYPGLGIFFLCFFVMFAPWEWDNTKVMVWGYLLILPALKEILETQIKPTARAILLVALYFSGVVSILATYNSSQTGVEVYNREEVDQVCEALKPLKQSDVVAVVQTFNHPVAICGQQVLLGYGGHLWSHGIKAAPIEEKLRKVMNGDDGWQMLVKELNIRYIFWGTREKDQFRESKKPWALESSIFKSGTWGHIYKVGEF